MRTDDTKGWAGLPGWGRGTEGRHVGSSNGIAKHTVSTVISHRAGYPWLLSINSSDVSGVLCWYEEGQDPAGFVNLACKHYDPLVSNCCYSGTDISLTYVDVCNNTMVLANAFGNVQL